MSEFNFDEPSPKSSGGSRFELWDILSIVVLLITLCLGILFLTIFVNPASAFNPFKPAELLVPPATATPIPPTATWTLIPSATATITNTPPPTITLAPTNTQAVLVPPTNTPIPTRTPTFTPTPKAPFSAVSVTAIDSTIIHPDSGCDWLGVGGTVDDQNNSPIVGIVVRLTGYLDGKSIDMTNLSGINLEYGKAGFEFYLGDTPIASNKDLYVQLLDQAGLPLSEQIYIRTYDDCSKNLVLIRFKKNR